MCTKSSQTSGRLRVTQAFIALSGIPVSSSAPKAISVVSLGKYEIRMFDGAPRSDDIAPLWIELFDHDTQKAVDSCSCSEIDDAVAAFDELISQAESLNAARGIDADDTQV